MRIPFALIEGRERNSVLAPPVVLVIWVTPGAGAVASKMKTSPLPSALSPVRSLSEVKAMRVPSALSDG